MALREDMVKAGVDFLTNPKVSGTSASEKQTFLARKGMTSAEISEAERRAALGNSAAAGSSMPPAAGPPAAGGYGGVPQHMQAAPPAAPPWQGAMYPAWQGYPRPPPPWQAPPQENSAPWWALLIAGLGLGSAIAMLGSLFWQRRSKEPTSGGWVRYDGLMQPPQAQLQAQPQAQPQLALPVAGQMQPAMAAPAPAAPPAGEPTAKAATAADDALSPAKLEELMAKMKAQAQETREATASLRRTLEQQQWQYQRAVSDFHLKMEEASRRKSNMASQRIEISPESLQMLKSMLHPGGKANNSGSAETNGSSEDLREWFGQVEQSLHRLLRSAGTKAEAKKHLQTTSLIIHNLVANPLQEKYREVNTASVRVRETFDGSDGGAAELLRLAGFESRDQAFVFPAEHDFDAAERVRDILQEALRDCEKRWEQARSNDVEAGGAATVDAALESVPLPTSNNHETQPPWSAQAPWASSRSSPAASSDPPKPAAAPWLSSVAQKQLAQLPARGAAEEEAPRQGPLQGAAHPAEAREGTQEPQSGG